VLGSDLLLLEEAQPNLIWVFYQEKQNNKKKSKKVIQFQDSIMLHHQLWIITNGFKLLNII
jgi:hypothetical protein